MSIVWSSSTAYPRSMHLTQTLLLCVSSVGALAPSTPDGNSAGVMPRLQVNPPALRRNLLLRFRWPRFSRRRCAATLLAHRHRADDPILHDRGVALRDPPLTSLGRIPCLVRVVR